MSAPVEETRRASAGHGLGEPELALVRYGELALKGRNRRMFEDALVRNLIAAVRPISAARVERSPGRLIVRPERAATEVARRACEVFGVKSVSPVWTCASEPEAIVALSRAVLGDHLARRPGPPPTFRVESRRAEKSFPIHSNDLDRHVAEHVLPDFPQVRVKLVDPELVLGIEVREARTYVFVDRIAGPGGLPVGTLGRALCLLSGGIDSPVAAWMAMKRGLSVSFVTYHSWPFIGDASKRKVEGIARALGRWQPPARLYVVPFADVQTAVRDAAPEPYRTVLYRRAMQRIASAIAGRDSFSALVTGESLGQVASQTLENITCIEAAAQLPVLRPLIGFDKDETIALARRIGTFELSNVQEPDCCTVFLPRSPVIRGKVEECERIETRFDLAGLVAKAVETAEIVRIEGG